MKFNGLICINLQICKTYTSGKNCCHFAVRLSNLINGKSNQIYRSTGCKETKQLETTVNPADERARSKVFYQ